MDMKKIGAVGAAAVAAAGIATLVPNTTEIEGEYDIDIVNPYRAELRIDVPQDFTPDIVALKLNDMEVAKTLLPSGIIVTYPTVVTNLDRLSLDMYVRGSNAATAYFDDDGKLIITVDDKFLDGTPEAAQTQESAPTATPSHSEIFEDVISTDWNGGGTDVE